MATNQGFKSFIPKPDRIHAKFLYHWLRRHRPYLESLGNGATFKEVSKAVVSRIEIALPPLPDQRRIADVLDRTEALRAKRRATLGQLDTLTQFIFLEMFGDPATNPKGWSVAPLAELCTIAGEYGAGVASKEYDPGLPRYVRITDVTGSGDLNEDAVSPAGAKRLWEGYLLSPGDVLFARSGATVGKTYIHRQSHGSCVFAGYLIRFRPRAELLLPEFLFQYTRMPAYRQWVTARQRVVAQPNINARQYGQDLQIPLPPMALQGAFADRIAAIETLKGTQRASLAELDTLFASLQHRAFRGEL